MKTFLIILGVILVLGVSFFSWKISVSNTEIKLRNKIETQQEVVEIFYTKLWEILKDQAGVANEYAEQFKEIQLGIMEGRYSSGGEMMKWITEANPTFDVSLYKGLMNSINGERNGFFIEQKKLMDMAKIHRDMLMVFPEALIVGDREQIEIIVLKNTSTKKAFETGTDSLPGLF